MASSWTRLYLYNKYVMPIGYDAWTRITAAIKLAL